MFPVGAWIISPQSNDLLFLLAAVSSKFVNFSYFIAFLISGPELFGIVGKLRQEQARQSENDKLSHPLLPGFFVKNQQSYYQCRRQDSINHALAGQVFPVLDDKNCEICCRSIQKRLGLVFDLAEGNPGHEDQDKDAEIRVAGPVATGQLEE